MRMHELYYLIYNREYIELLGLDQLKQAMLQNQTLNDMKEGELLFDPTYKYVKGGTRYIGEDALGFS